MIGPNRRDTRKSLQQVRYLLSKASPLTGRQKAELKSELHTGKVRVKHGGK